MTAGARGLAKKRLAAYDRHSRDATLAAAPPDPVIPVFVCVCLPELLFLACSRRQ